MKKKSLMALCLVLALLISLCGCSGEKAEAYRIIQVLEISGTVSVERASMGTMDVYEGMRLEAGDRITVGSESWLKIKMDEDKYALVEPDSVMRLEASGSSADSKTVFHLESGAVSNRLEAQLSDASSYEVNTPNSTMAVRGTVFRVEVSIDEEGVSISNVSVYGGSVASRLVYPDGTTDPEEAAVMIVDGTVARILGNSTLSKYLTTGETLDLNDLRLKTLEFLKESIEAGEDLAVSPEELDELIEALKQKPESGEQEEATTAPTREAAEPGDESPEPTTAPTTPKPTTPKPTTPKPTTPSPTTPKPTTPAPTIPPATQEPTTEPTEETTEATEPPSYTVTFRYNSSVFATQTVVSGATAAAPKLQPAVSGFWDFDFTTPITQDTVVMWSIN